MCGEGGDGGEYWRTIFNISDDIKTNHGPGLPEYKNHVTDSCVAWLRQSK